MTLDDDYPLRSIDRVVVTVSGTSPGENPGLADRIQTALATTTDDPVIVEVQYVVAEESDLAAEETPSITDSQYQNSASLETGRTLA